MSRVYAQPEDIHHPPPPPLYISPKSKATIIYLPSQPNRRHPQEGFTWHVVRAIGSGMQLAIEGLQELPSLLREPRPRPAAAFVGMWIVGKYIST